MTDEEILGRLFSELILFLFWPFAVIWAVNQFLPTQIDITFWTWLAAVILVSTFRSRGRVVVTNMKK